MVCSGGFLLSQNGLCPYIFTAKLHKKCESHKCYCHFLFLLLNKCQNVKRLYQNPKYLGYQQTSVSGYRTSAIFHQPSAIIHQTSDIFHHTSDFRHLPSFCYIMVRIFMHRVEKFGLQYGILHPLRHQLKLIMACVIKAYIPNLFTFSNHSFVFCRAKIQKNNPVPQYAVRDYFF